MRKTDAATASVRDGKEEEGRCGHAIPETKTEIHGRLKIAI